MKLTVSASGVAVLAGLVGAAGAAEFGDPVEGKRIAMQWCSSCHVVSDGQKAASADVPPFTEISKRYGGKMAFLEAFLSQSHPQMPNMQLGYLEIRNLVAYFEGL